MPPPSPARTWWCAAAPRCEKIIRDRAAATMAAKCSKPGVFMPVRIVEVRKAPKPIASPIRNAYIDFSKMTSSLVAVVPNVVRDGKPVIGYGFNSNGRYGQGG